QLAPARDGGAERGANAAAAGPIVGAAVARSCPTPAAPKARNCQGMGRPTRSISCSKRGRRSMADEVYDFEQGLRRARVKNGRRSKTADRNEAPWLADCIHGGGKNPKPLPVLANALIGLRAQWPDAVALDEMLCAPMLMQPLAGENDFAPRPLTDVDV